MSGLSTFMRKFHRSDNQSVPLNDLNSFNTLNSEPDQNYHEYIHSNNARSLTLGRLEVSETTLGTRDVR